MTYNHPKPPKITCNHLQPPTTTYNHLKPPKANNFWKYLSLQSIWNFILYDWTNI